VSSSIFSECTRCILKLVLGYDIANITILRVRMRVRMRGGEGVVGGRGVRVKRRPSP